MFERINILFICKNHFKTLYSLDGNGNGKVNLTELFVFYIGAVVLSSIMVFVFDIYITEEAANLLVQAFAVVGGFLINARFLLIDKQSHFDDSRKYTDIKTLIEETSHNTSFGVLVCFFNVLLSVGVILAQDVCVIYQILSVCVLSLTFIFCHVLLMIVRRLESILDT
jgi:uncharacterized membrane protein